MMDQVNQGSSPSFPNRRKRGRPLGDEGQAFTTTDENLIGRVFFAVVEGSFEAGYFLNVTVLDTEKQLKGIIFLRNKVALLTPATDLFPQAKMYVREAPSSTPPEVKKNQADDFSSEPQIDKNQSVMLPDNHPRSDAGVVGSEAMDTEMKDVGGSSADEKLTQPEDRTLSLMPQFASEDHIVMRSQAGEASKTAVTTTFSSTEDSFAKGSTTFVDFFPAPATNLKQATECCSSFSLELFQNETKQPGTEDEKSPEDAEPHGVEVKSDSSINDDVPKELQLELGNKKMNASAVVTEANPDQPASCKSGFLVDLFDSREETVKEPEESHAGSKSCFPEASTQVDDDDIDS